MDATVTEDPTCFCLVNLEVCSKEFLFLQASTGIGGEEGHAIVCPLRCLNKGTMLHCFFSYCVTVLCPHFCNLACGKSQPIG